MSPLVVSILLTFGSPATPAETAFAKLQSLVGKWEGKEGKDKYTISYKLTGGGSAVVETQFAGSPYEMMTVYTMDGPQLVATHYCAIQNQPFLKYVPGKDPNVLSFSLVSVGNKKPGQSVMNSIRHKFVAKDHIISTWVSVGNKEHAGTTILDVKRIH